MTLVASGTPEFRRSREYTYHCEPGVRCVNLVCDKNGTTPKISRTSCIPGYLNAMAKKSSASSQPARDDSGTKPQGHPASHRQAVSCHSPAAGKTKGQGHLTLMNDILTNMMEAEQRHVADRTDSPMYRWRSCRRQTANRDPSKILRHTARQ